MSKSSGKTRIYIIDDNKIVLEGLEAFIKREETMEVCGLSENVIGIMSKIESANPDVMIIDIGSKTGMDGIELAGQIHARYPGIKSIILSQHDNEIFADRAIRAGAMGYVIKSEVTQTLVFAIQQSLVGKIYISKN